MYPLLLQWFTGQKEVVRGENAHASRGDQIIGGLIQHFAHFDGSSGGNFKEFQHIDQDVSAKASKA